MKYAEFAERINAEYAKRFPESKCTVIEWSGLGKAIMIDCRLAGGRHECAHGMMENDMFSIKFNIDLPDNFKFDTDDLPENLVMTAMTSGYKIAPEDEFLYCSHRKVSYRATGGAADKVAEAFGKYLDKLTAMIKKDLENGKIHEAYTEIIHRKLS